MRVNILSLIGVLIVALMTNGCRDKAIVRSNVILFTKEIKPSDPMWWDSRDMQEFLILDDDNSVQIVNRRFGSVETLPIEWKNNSVIIGLEEYKILSEKDSEIWLLSQENDTIVDLKLTDPLPIIYSPDNQYMISSGKISIMLGYSTDTVSPYGVPVEIFQDGEEVYSGFANVETIGNNKELLYSELFTISKNSSDDDNKYSGYILDSLIVHDIELTKLSKQNVVFANYIFNPSVYARTSAISHYVLKNELIETSGTGFGSIDFTESNRSFLNTSDVYFPQIHIDSFGVVIINANNELSKPYSETFRSQASSNYYLKEDRQHKRISLSSDLDTVFNSSTYFFRTGDKLYEYFEVQDTFVRTL